MVNDLLLEEAEFAGHLLHPLDLGGERALEGALVRVQVLEL